MISSRRLRSWRSLILLCFAVLAFNRSASAQNGQDPEAVFIVRHAEKDTVRNDPGLTGVGTERAERLAEMLSSSAIQAIYTSQSARTRQTALPLAGRLNIEPTVISVTSQGTQSHVDSLIAAIRKHHPRKRVLIVSHSNIIHRIVAGFGGDGVEEISEHDYGNLFVLVFQPNGKPTLLKLRF